MFGRYDVVLTSETIYSEESQEKLYKLIKGLLKANGVAYPFPFNSFL